MSTQALMADHDEATSERALAIASDLSWSPDASFRERDQELGPEFAVSVFAPDGTLTELPAGVLAVLSAFGQGATAGAVCDRLGMPSDQVAVIAELAATLEQRGFLVGTGDSTPSPAPAVPATFLVTAHGCGGTLLRLFLDAHPRLACAPPHRFANCLRDMIDLASQTDGFSSMQLDQPAAVRSLGETVAGLPALHARLRQKDGWVWASRDHDLCLEFLDDLFDHSARFLCLVRHPLDATDSSARRYAREGWQATRMIEEVRRHGDPHVAYAHYWTAVFGRIRAFREAHPERVLVVRYEDLVRSTDVTLAQLLHFCGLSMPASIVADAFARPHEMLEGGWESFGFESEAGVRDDQVGLWHAWDEQLLAEVSNIVDAEMRHWGYEPSGG